VITTAAMDEAGKSAWCREHGVYPAELDQWCANATAAWPSPRRPAPVRRRRGKTRSASRSSNANCCAKTGRWPKRQLYWSCQKVAAIFNKGGRMIGLEDRQALARDIHAAQAAGRV
jgi:hypothetical protein